MKPFPPFLSLPLSSGFAGLLLLCAPLRTQAAAEERPLLREFTGLCGHTVAFKPELYKAVCGVVRDYHPVEWDLPDDTSMLPEWPEARNRVSWAEVYGSWHRAGLKINVCLMIDGMDKKWKDPVKDSFAYGKSFAENFGPGGKWPYVEWVEIGNEPGLYTDEDWVKVMESMAKGIREANPRLKIVTCNIESTKSDRYWKGADLYKDRDALYDVIQIHRYAIAEQWPVWRRSYPENPKVPFLSSIRELKEWRDKNAPDKKLWVTEFGWDSSSKKPDPAGEWAKWVGSTDDEQARWIVRSFLLFAEMGIDKAFTYFFNDDDTPQLHGASGLTRKYQPKPAFHASAWMLKSLGGHRFSKALKNSLEEGYAYEFTPEKAGDPVIIAAWHATKDSTLALPADGRKVLKAERMPLTPGDAETVTVSTKTDSGGEWSLPISEKPILLWVEPTAK
ncbi:MAG: hypothetical protein JWM59_4793 [Verrucomicrobiales bacterium]|nr:hypothetical protein [Verrucomicrobiales bacterium]